VGVLVDFLIDRTKPFDRLQGQLNEKQKIELLHMFREGTDGFKASLSWRWPHQRDLVHQIARSRVALPETPGDGGVLVSRDLQKLKAVMQASGR
jgi:hypothetical protein